MLDSWLDEYEDFQIPPERLGGVDFSDFEQDSDINKIFGGWGGVRPYEFNLDNPFLSHPNPMEVGIDLFNRGELSEAILAFEAAAQRYVLLTFLSLGKETYSAG